MNSEQQYDDTYRRAPQNLNIALLHNSIAELQPHQTFQHETPTYLSGGPQDVSWTTLSNGFQTPQQTAEVNEHSQIQDSRLASHIVSQQENLKRKLEREDLRHARKRNQILGSHALHGVHQPIRTVYSYGDASFHTMPSTGGAADAYNSFRMTPSLQEPFHADTAFNQMSQNYPITNDGGTSQEPIFDPGCIQAGPMISLSPTSFSAYTQEPAPSCINPPYSAYNDLGITPHTAFSQPPAIQALPFIPSSYHVPVPSLNVDGQQIHSHLLEASPNLHTVQQNFFQSDDGSLSLPSTDAKASSLPFVADPFSIMAAPFAAPVSPQGLIQPDHGTSIALLSTSPPLSVFKQLSVPGLNSTGPIISPVSSQTRTSIDKAGCERAQSRPVSKGQHVAVMHEFSKHIGKTGGNIDNMCFYTDPVTDREASRARKRTRSVYRKIDRACFLCRISKQACERKGDGPCSACKRFVKRYVHQSAIPRFTCDMQTRFSELTLLPFQPTDYAPEDVIRPTDVLVGSSAWISSGLRVLRPFLPIMDSLEPERTRRFNRGPIFIEILVYYSYCLSIIRWKRALLYLTPQLWRHINTLEQGFKEVSEMLLRFFDHSYFYRNSLMAVCMLAFMYDEVYFLKACDTVDQSAVEHFESALETRLAILCGPLFAEDSATKKKQVQRKELAVRVHIFGKFSKATKFLPPQYRGCPPYIHESYAAGSPVYPPCRKWASERAFIRQDPQQSSGRPRCYCEGAMRCLPAGFLAGLSTDVETFSCQLHHTEHHSHDPLYQLRVVFIQAFGEEASRLDDSIMNIFIVSMRHAVTFLFRKYFDSIAAEITSESLQNFDSSNRKGLRKAEYDEMMCRIIFTAMSLQSLFFSRLLKNEREKLTGPENLDELHNAFQTWVNESEVSTMINDGFVSQVRQAILDRKLFLVQELDRHPTPGQ